MHIRQCWTLKNGSLVNRDEENICQKDDQIWNLPTPIGYMECNKGVLEVRTDFLGEMVRDEETRGNIDVILATKVSPMPDNQEWEILKTSHNDFFNIRHYSSGLLLTCQVGGNLTLNEQGKLEIH